MLAGAKKKRQRKDGFFMSQLAHRFFHHGKFEKLAEGAE